MMRGESAVLSTESIATKARQLRSREVSLFYEARSRASSTYVVVDRFD